MDFKTVIAKLIKRFRRGPDRESSPLSPSAEKEFQEMARSESLRQDMETVQRNRHNPFIRKDGGVDADAYLAFVTEFNEFIGHDPKPFRQIIDKDMRL